MILISKGKDWKSSSVNVNHYSLLIVQIDWQIETELISSVINVGGCVQTRRGRKSWDQLLISLQPLSPPRRPLARPLYESWVASLMSRSLVTITPTLASWGSHYLLRGHWPRSLGHPRFLSDVLITDTDPGPEAATLFSGFLMTCISALAAYLMSRAVTPGPQVRAQVTAIRHLVFLLFLLNLCQLSIYLSSQRKSFQQPSFRHSWI